MPVSAMVTAILSAVAAGVLFAANPPKRWWGLLLAFLGAPAVIGYLAFIAYDKAPLAPLAYVYERAQVHEAVAQRAEVATDAEVAAIAAAEPKIDLDSEGPEADDDAKPSTKNRPAWVNGDVLENQTVITSGPFTTAESCREDTHKQLCDLLAERLGVEGLTAGVDPRFLVLKEYPETRETSVGEVHLLYTLAEMTPEVEAKVAESLAEAFEKIDRRRNVNEVAGLGAGVLSLLALTHIVLRAGGRRSP